MTTEWLYAPLRRLAAATRSGTLSAVTLVEAHLARIAAVNPQLNAVVALDAERALATAAAADRARAAGQPLGALHGVPMTIKDSLDTAGVVTTWGTPGYAGRIPPHDATVVARLRAAGAILLGKTNTPELTLSYETDNPLHGRTNNPYDLTRAPAGSSGGAAAIVAVGGSPFDIGSDTGGSIRQPAHACGLAGLKPTTGRVPRTGHAIGPHGWLNALTALGPLARYVDDLVYLLPIIAGPDGVDPACAPVPLHDPTGIDPTRLRVAWFSDNGIRAAEPAVATAVAAAADWLAAAGVHIVAERPPAIEQSQLLLGELMRGADGGEWVRQLLRTCGTPFDQSSLTRYLGVTPRPAETIAADLIGVLARRDRFRSALLAFFQRYDAILSPVNAYPALPHDSFAGDAYPGFSYTMTFNLTGGPAAVVRAGQTADGLPIGVQIAAAPWREEIVLALAAIVEAASGGWQPPAAFAVAPA